MQMKSVIMTVLLPMFCYDAEDMLYNNVLRRKTYVIFSLLFLLFVRMSYLPHEQMRTVWSLAISVMSLTCLTKEG